MIFSSRTKEKALPVKTKGLPVRLNKSNEKSKGKNSKTRNMDKNLKTRNITLMIDGCTCVFLIAASSADLQNTLAVDLRIPRTLLFRDEQIR